MFSELQPRRTVRFVSGGTSLRAKHYAFIALFVGVTFGRGKEPVALSANCSLDTWVDRPETWTGAGTVQALQVWRGDLYAGVWGAQKSQVWKFHCDGSKWKATQFGPAFDEQKITALNADETTLFVGSGNEPGGTARLYAMDSQGGRRLVASEPKLPWSLAGYPWALLQTPDRAGRPRLVVGTAGVEDGTGPLAYVAEQVEGGWRLLGDNGPWRNTPPGTTNRYYSHVDALLADPRDKRVIFAALAMSRPQSLAGGAAVWRYSPDSDSWTELSRGAFIANGAGPAWAEDLAIHHGRLFVANQPYNTSCGTNDSLKWHPVWTCTLQGGDCKDWSALPTFVNAWGDDQVAHKRPTQLARIFTFRHASGRETLHALAGYSIWTPTDDCASPRPKTLVFQLVETGADVRRWDWKLEHTEDGCAWAYAAVQWGDTAFVGYSACTSHPRVQALRFR